MASKKKNLAMAIRNRRCTTGLATGLMSVVLAACAGAATIHATPGGANPLGASWATPTSLTNALAICTAADEIWLAEGAYTNNATFTVGNDRTVYGGFTTSMSSRNQRDWNVHPTILNGNSQNLRVVTVSGANVTLDGLIVTNSSGAAAGGIVKAVAGALTLANCRIMGHASAGMGVGGNFSAGSVLMTNCLVAGNTPANYFIRGFGIYSSGAGLQLADCVFSNNYSVNSGHRGCSGFGLYFINGTLGALRTDFIDNSGYGNDSGGGGGVYVGGATTATFSNCVIRGNRVLGSDRPTSKGGGIWLALGAASTARVVNCTFTSNVNAYGDGGAIHLDSGTLILKNSILWDNDVGSAYTGKELYRAGGALDASYCDLTGLSAPQVVWVATLANCMTNDPLFASATDLHLQSKAGRWDPVANMFVTTDTGYSPCIDAGDPVDPISAEPADNGNVRINMGRYGGAAQASKSPPVVVPLLANMGAVPFYSRAWVSGALINPTYVTAIVGLCYGASSVAGDTTNGWEYVSVLDTPQHTGAIFAVPTAALLPSTTYYYRWVATNAAGAAWTPAATFVTGPASPGGGLNVIHVNRLATGAADGSDWASAYTKISDAFLVLGGTRINIWMTGGTYNEGSLLTLSQSATLIGGFAGTEYSVSQRALTNAFGVVTNYTVINGEGSHACLSITAGDVTMDALALSNSYGAVAGGGIAKSGSGALKMSNCRIVNNTGTGGSMTGVGGKFTGGSVLMTNCVVANNTVTYYFVKGFGIYSFGADLQLVDCVFSNNSSAANGGTRGANGMGLYFDNGTLRALRTDFILNKGPATASGTCGGAGVCLGNNAATVVSFSNCVFRGNEALNAGWGDGNGGAMWLNLAATVTARVVNCTFADNMNRQGNGGAIYLGGGTLVLKNSILWTNAVVAGYTGSEIYANGANSRAIISYGDLAGIAAPQVVTIGGATLEWGAGVIVIDPLYTSATDVHIQSTRGRWDPAVRRFVATDLNNSPCIDAGDPADPVGAEHSPSGRRINLGAYGGTAQASVSIAAGTIFRAR